jgi:hypothetical protein
MRASERVDRYALIDLVSSDEAVDGLPVSQLWHGYDETLDRPVALRILSADDPRAAAVVGAARAAAAVDDRRLLRVLDILDLPGRNGESGQIAIVSEWATGRNLERTLEDRHGTPFSAPEALETVAEVARAVARGTAEGVGHGRLRPSSVFITDAGEVRVRGLAVDAALFGPLPDVPDRAAADVDALGSLVYLLTTGYWPGAATVEAPAAPEAGGVVLPPSQVRAAVPRSVDDIVARSVVSAARARGVARVADPDAFAAMAGAALDHVAPVTTTTVRTEPVTPGRRAVRTTLRWSLRLIVVALALAFVGAVAWGGWNLITAEPDEPADANQDLAAILTTPARPADDIEIAGIERTYPIDKFRSYDPFGDDNGNGKPDKRKGRESEELVGVVNDDDPDTAWLTSQYDTADLDGKGGVGLIIDLGSPQDVQQVTANLIGRGSSLEVKVGDRIYPDPALWTPLATAVAPRDTMQVRAPRPITARYVLLWFTKLPPTDSGSGEFQGGVRSVVVSG